MSSRLFSSQSNSTNRWWKTFSLQKVVRNWRDWRVRCIPSTICEPKEKKCCTMLQLLRVAWVRLVHWVIWVNFMSTILTATFFPLWNQFIISVNVSVVALTSTPITATKTKLYFWFILSHRYVETINAINESAKIHFCTRPTNHKLLAIKTKMLLWVFVKWSLKLEHFNETIKRHWSTAFRYFHGSKRAHHLMDITTTVRIFLCHCYTQWKIEK